MFLFNRLSTVQAGGESFRNPPHFMPLAGQFNPTNQDWTSEDLMLPNAEHETEALLEHLFEHDATAVFVSTRLIQRLVTSNPTPRYVKEVVNAFRTGAYGGVTYSGRYGDLRATLMAILSDREARNPIMEADPFFGSMREPLVKVVQAIRALQWNSPYEQQLNRMEDILGQQAHAQPSVFGFYLPEHRPQGSINDAGLVAPEFEIMTSPAMINFLNAASQMSLGSLHNGFGDNLASGSMTYVPPSTSAQVADRLDILFTAGRMTPETKALVIRMYDEQSRARNAQVAFQRSLELVLASSEYHTNTVRMPAAGVVPALPFIKGRGRQHKTIIVMFQHGGADSFNLLVPHSQCTGKDYYAEYRQVRGANAHAADQVHQIPAGSTQPCRTFGLHPIMSNLASMYRAGEAAMLSSIGTLIVPLTKEEALKRTKPIPPSVGAHNIQQQSAQNVHAQVATSKGIFGRIMTSLTTLAAPFSSAVYSLTGSKKILEGTVPPTMVNRRTGLTRYTNYNVMSSYIKEMTSGSSVNVFADHYSAILKNAVETSEKYGALLAATNTNTTWDASGDVDEQFKMVARLLKMRDGLGLERSVFMLGSGGWDTHGSYNTNDQYGKIDTALGKFREEMISQKLWENTVVVTLSDFGRTLVGNGVGTDHAWAGNHMLVGGGVKGARIHGQFPPGLTGSAETVLNSRGRVLPTTPWEGLWYGLAQWFGVPARDMDTVLPNAKNFPTQLLDRNALFK